MRAKEIPIVTPCGADWSEMTPLEAKSRLCAACDKVVSDVSKMSEREVRQALASGPFCVRYLYDEHGKVIFGDAPKGATVVPASALLSKIARSKWVAAAALAAVPLVFEACGGVGGGFERGYDAGSASPNDDDPKQPSRTIQEPTVDDGGADASDAGVSDARADAPDAD